MPDFLQIGREVLRHFLREGGNKDTFVLLDAFIDLTR